MSRLVTFSVGRFPNDRVSVLQEDQRNGKRDTVGACRPKICATTAERQYNGVASVATQYAPSIVYRSTTTGMEPQVCLLYGWSTYQ